MSAVREQACEPLGLRRKIRGQALQQLLRVLREQIVEGLPFEAPDALQGLAARPVLAHEAQADGSRDRRRPRRSANGPRIEREATAREALQVAARARLLFRHAHREADRESRAAAVRPEMPAPMTTTSQPASGLALEAPCSPLRLEAARSVAAKGGTAPPTRPRMRTGGCVSGARLARRVCRRSPESRRQAEPRAREAPVERALLGSGPLRGRRKTSRPGPGDRGARKKPGAD